MKLMGHRGARNEKPENTLLGFEHVLNLGLKAIELDIHSSLDKRLMVIHDSTLERTTNGEGPVNSFSSTELRDFDAGEGQKIPYLEEVFDLLLPKGVEIQVEIKDGTTLSALSTLVKGLKKDYQDLITVISFHHKWLRDYKEANSTISTAALIYAYPLKPQEIAKAALSQGLSFNTQFLDSELVGKCREHSLSITGWNANTKDEYQRVKALEIDFLGTDNPTDCLAWD